MLGFFPSLFPGESVRSWVSRAAVRHLWTSDKEVAKILFGVDASLAANELPVRLQSLVDQLPSGHALCSSDLVELHTSFRFHAAFIPEEKRNGLRDLMLSGKGGKISRFINSDVMCRPLLFCPVCVHEDVEKYGEPYWHQLHQTEGVKVCPRHGVFLEKAAIAENDRKLKLFVPPSEGMGLAEAPRMIVQSDAEHAHLLAIAKDAEWLISNPSSVISLDNLRCRYYDCLQQRGFLTSEGQLKHAKLVSEVRSFYGDYVIHTLGAKIPSFLWLKQLGTEKKKTPGTVQHLLLTRFLSMTIKEIIAVGL